MGLGRINKNIQIKDQLHYFITNQCSYKDMQQFLVLPWMLQKVVLIYLHLETCQIQE